jgi:hypothetical protein
MVLGRAAGPHYTVRMTRQTVVSTVGRARGRSVAVAPRVSVPQLLPSSPRVRFRTDASDEDVQLVKKLAVTRHAAQVPINDCPATID